MGHGGCAARRRVDIEDVIDAHLLALDKAQFIGFGRYIISATTPFTEADLADLRRDATATVGRLFPGMTALYAVRGCSMFQQFDRVYVNTLARRELGWNPKYDFSHILNCLRDGKDWRSPLARIVGSKGYHDQIFEDGPYPLQGR
jgi:UDP-glucose 4-epimerase